MACFRTPQSIFTQRIDLVKQIGPAEFSVEEKHRLRARHLFRPRPIQYWATTVQLPGSGFDRAGNALHMRAMVSLPVLIPG